MKCFPGLSRFSLAKGTDPDPRFTLANERTFLAWTRTSLAMMAAGIAVEAFAEELLTQPFRSSIAVSLMLLAAVISVFACLRWFAVERALRSREPLPVPWQVPIVSLVLFLGTLVFTVVLLN